MTKRKIYIKASLVEAVAELNDTRTAEHIWQALPIKSTVQTWGNEVYFAIPLTLTQENAREVVEVGELGYWPLGKAFCIFFGSTPVSRGNEIRPASPVNVFGRVISDATIFEKVGASTEIIVIKGNGN
ncbi:cyclophilin-like fold protein [Chloroflexota bacterium]